MFRADQKIKPECEVDHVRSHSDSHTLSRGGLIAPVQPKHGLLQVTQAALGLHLAATFGVREAAKAMDGLRPGQVAERMRSGHPVCLGT